MESLEEVVYNGIMKMLWIMESSEEVVDNGIIRGVCG